jgi:hypothetical protein
MSETQAVYLGMTRSVALRRSCVIRGVGLDLFKVSRDHPRPYDDPTGLSPKKTPLASLLR